MPTQDPQARRLRIPRRVALQKDQSKQTEIVRGQASQTLAHERLGNALLWSTLGMLPFHDV